jgi:ribosome biogenesis GTPase
MGRREEVSLAAKGEGGGTRKDLKGFARAIRKAREKPVRQKRWAEAMQDEDADAGAPRDQKMRRPRENRASTIIRQVAEGGVAGGPDARGEPMGWGMVVGVRRRSCRVRLPDREVECLIPTEMAVFQQTALAVGDQVEVAQGDAKPIVVAVASRRSKLSRPDPTIPGVERVVVANVETVVIVASVVAPCFNPGLVDRYLVAVQAGGATSVLCVNKLDLAAEPAEVAIYRDAGVRVIGASCVDRRGLDELVAAIRGRLCAFVGHSGVGKTSLLNALAPGLHLLTMPVRERDGRGRHATTFSALYELGEGIRVIDTPGVREIGLWRMAPEDVRFYFPEFNAFSPCHFRDCSHTHEPGCAVKAAVEGGRLPQARYDSYLRILDSLRDAT